MSVKITLLRECEMDQNRLTDRIKKTDKQTKISRERHIDTLAQRQSQLETERRTEKNRDNRNEERRQNVRQSSKEWHGEEHTLCIW